jgi:hypothetical protein
MLTFATNLASFCRSKHLKGRSYTNWEASGYFLEELLAMGSLSPATSRTSVTYPLTPQFPPVSRSRISCPDEPQPVTTSSPLLGATRPIGLSHRLRDSTTPRHLQASSIPADTAVFVTDPDHIDYSDFPAPMSPPTPLPDT